MAIDFTSLNAEVSAPQEVVPTTPNISLNLEKNSLLNLAKATPGLMKVNLCAGWDVAGNGEDFDLDISVFTCHENGKIASANDVIFYNHKEVAGIKLNKDNRTGAGDGDDEIISIHFSEIDPSIKKIICCVTIDQAIQRQQTFGMVSNSYVRLVNSETNEEIAKFTLKNDYDTSTAVIFAELVHTDGNWVFHTIGEGLVADLNQIVVRFQ